MVADVDLDLLDEQRVNGSVIPLQDLIKDAYDSVVHYSDYKGQKPTQSGADGDAADGRSLKMDDYAEADLLEVAAV